MGNQEIYSKWAEHFRKERRTECDCCGATLRQGYNTGVNLFFWVDFEDNIQEMVVCRECKHRAYQKIGESGSRISWSGEDLSGQVSLFQVEPK